MTFKPPLPSLAVRCILERIRGTKLLAAAADSEFLTGDEGRAYRLLAVGERECNEILGEITGLTEDDADSVEPFFTPLEIYFLPPTAFSHIGALATKLEMLAN